MKKAPSVCLLLGLLLPNQRAYSLNGSDSRRRLLHDGIQRPAGFDIKGIDLFGLLLPGLDTHGSGHRNHRAVVRAQVQLGVVHADAALVAGLVELLLFMSLIEW